MLYGTRFSGASKSAEPFIFDEAEDYCIASQGLLEFSAKFAKTSEQLLGSQPRDPRAAEEPGGSIKANEILSDPPDLLDLPDVIRVTVATLTVISGSIRTLPQASIDRILDGSLIQAKALLFWVYYMLRKRGSQSSLFPLSPGVKSKSIKW
ncbi:unnamed protein product [Diplocarpon coronariae]